MRFLPILASAAVLAAAACSRNEPVDENAMMPMNDVPMTDGGAATNNAMMDSAPSKNFTGADGAALGSVTMEDSAGGLILTLAGANMPAGTHGLHIHAVGKCEGPKFESAGSHWNPTNKQHGTENPQGPHKGDLPNVTVPADGMLNQTITVPGVTTAELMDGDGSALVVHASADDNKTDPSGNSGDRIACAVLAPAK